MRSCRWNTVSTAHPLERAAPPCNFDLRPQSPPPKGTLVHEQVTAGQTLHICNAETGQTVGKHVHSALPGNIHWQTGRPVSPVQVQGSQDGRLIFLAGSDGAIVALDPR